MSKSLTAELRQNAPFFPFYGVALDMSLVFSELRILCQADHDLLNSTIGRHHDNFSSTSTCWQSIRQMRVREKQSYTLRARVNVHREE